MVYKNLPVTPNVHDAVNVYASARPMNMREAASTLIILGFIHAKDYEDDRRVPHIPG